MEDQKIKIVDSGVWVLIFVLIFIGMTLVDTLDSIKKEIHDLNITTDWFRNDYNKMSVPTVLPTDMINGDCGLSKPPCWEDGRHNTIRLK